MTGNPKPVPPRLRSWLGSLARVCMDEKKDYESVACIFGQIGIHGPGCPSDVDMSDPSDVFLAEEQPRYRKMAFDIVEKYGRSLEEIAKVLRADYERAPEETCEGPECYWNHHPAEEHKKEHEYSGRLFLRSHARGLVQVIEDELKNRAQPA